MIDTLLEKNLVPEFLIRRHIRKLLGQRIKTESQFRTDCGNSYRSKVKEMLSSGPIAIETRKANEQHYELPPEFFEIILGRHLKYSSGHWDESTNLDSSETEMLNLTCERAGLQDGMDILELGCGWGSLTLFMAEKFPGSTITGVSNSAAQANFINKKAFQKGIKNIQIITCDINQFRIEKTFDRIVSVEMFEHMRNYDLLLRKVASWLKADGKIFIHIFTHKDLFYKFDVIDETDWMSRYFFSGGIMPSDWLLHEFSDILNVKEHWKVNGINYSRTAEAWLNNMIENKERVLKIFNKVYPGQELKWFVYWKIFFISCSELWKYDQGNEWIVSHYLLEK